MLPHIYNNYSKDSFASLGFTNNTKKFFYIPKKKPLKTYEKTEIIAASTIGTAIPLILAAKKQKLPIHKIQYTTKDMLLLSTGSILGGISGGILVDKGKNTKEKIKEGVFQFFNAIVPTLLIKPILYLCEHVKALNNNKIKPTLLLGGIFGGMVLGAEISNKINNNDENHKRKVKFIDSIANIDVISGALIMAKIPLINKLGIEKFLPLPYIWTGYEAGRTRE